MQNTIFSLIVSRQTVQRLPAPLIITTFFTEYNVSPSTICTTGTSGQPLGEPISGLGAYTRIVAIVEADTVYLTHRPLQDAQLLTCLGASCCLPECRDISPHSAASSPCCSGKASEPVQTCANSLALAIPRTLPILARLPFRVYHEKQRKRRYQFRIIPRAGTAYKQCLPRCQTNSTSDTPTPRTVRPSSAYELIATASKLRSTIRLFFSMHYFRVQPLGIHGPYRLTGAPPDTVTRGSQGHTRAWMRASAHFVQSQSLTRNDEPLGNALGNSRSLSRGIALLVGKSKTTGSGTTHRSTTFC